MTERETATKEWWLLTNAMHEGQIDDEDRPIVQSRINELVKIVKDLMEQEDMNT